MANEFRVKNGIISSSIATDSGDFTVDSAGDIVFDADGADILLKDGGTEFGRFKRDSSNFVIKSATNDKDIIFKGVDNNSTITALTLDMSAAGAATFNDMITAVGTSVFTNLDISGDVDIDGTLETDALTVGGATALIAGAQTAVTTDFNTGRKVGRDADNLIDFSTDNVITLRTSATDSFKIYNNLVLLHEDTSPKFELFTWENAETTDGTRVSMKGFHNSQGTNGMILKSEITVNTASHGGQASEYWTSNGPIHFQGHDDTYGFWGPISAPSSGQMGALLIAKTTYHDEYTESGGVSPRSQLEVRSPAGAPGTLTLSTEEATVVDGDKLGRIDFMAPKETGTDAIAIAASVWAEADDTFAADNNATDLVFATGASEAATEKFRITHEGHLVPSSDDASDLGTSALQFKDGYFDGTLEADAITIGGTAIGSIYSPVAGHASIVTVGTIGTGTWQGTAIASAYLDSDTAHLSGAQTFSGNKTFSGSITIGGHAFDDIDIGSEFVDTDDHIMSSGAIKEKIEDYGYTTNTGDITGVTAGTNLSGGGSSGSVTLNVDDAFLVNDANDTTSGTITAAGFTTTGTWTFDDASSGTVGITTVHTGSGFADNDTSLMTAGAIKEKIEDYGYTTNTGDITGVTAGTNLSGGGSSGSVTLNVDDAFLVNDANDTTTGTITAAGFTTTGSITLSGGAHSFNDIDIGSEFVDTDDHIMSSGAIKEKIESYGYTTNTGDITGVDLTVTSPITIASETNTGSGSYSATLGLDDPANLSELNESTDATDDKILLWDESGGSWKYMTLDNLQDSIDTTGGGGSGISDIVEDTSPQLGGDLDTNSRNIIIDDAHGIYDENSNEQMLFQTVANATAYFQIWNGISDSTTGTLFGTDAVTHDTAGGGRMTGPGIEATGSATDVGFTMRTKGLGQFVMMNDDTTTAAAPVLTLLRYHTSESDDDVLGLIKFVGPDSSMDNPGLEDHRDYAKIECNLVDSNTSSADGNLMFSALVANSHTDMMRVGVHEDDDNAVGVALFRGQMIDHGSNHTLTYADEAGCYVRATAAITLTLPASPSKGEQYVIISDHAGTTTISANGSDTMNGSTNNQTITTRYEAKTFIAVSSSAWIVVG